MRTLMAACEALLAGFLAFLATEVFFLSIWQFALLDGDHWAYAWGLLWNEEVELASLKDWALYGGLVALAPVLLGFMAAWFFFSPLSSMLVRAGEKAGRRRAAKKREEQELPPERRENYRAASSVAESRDLDNGPHVLEKKPAFIEKDSVDVSPPTQERKAFEFGVKDPAAGGGNQQEEVPGEGEALQITREGVINEITRHLVRTSWAVRPVVKVDADRAPEGTILTDLPRPRTDIIDVVACTLGEAALFKVVDLADQVWEPTPLSLANSKIPKWTPEDGGKGMSCPLKSAMNAKALFWAQHGAMLQANLGMRQNDLAVYVYLLNGGVTDLGLVDPDILEDSYELYLLFDRDIVEANPSFEEIRNRTLSGTFSGNVEGDAVVDQTLAEIIRESATATQ